LPQSAGVNVNYEQISEGKPDPCLTPLTPLNYWPNGGNREKRALFLTSSALRLQAAGLLAVESNSPLDCTVGKAAQA